LPKAVVNATMHGGLRVNAGGGVACRVPGQQLKAFVDGPDGPDVESSCLNRTDNVAVEHEVAHVAGGDHDSLISREAAHLAHAEEAFDLLRDPSDRLHVAALINRTGHRDA